MRFKLNKSGLRALSSLCTNFSAVFLGSLVLPAFIVDDFQWFLVVLGLIGIIAAGYMAILFAQKGKL